MELPRIYLTGAAGALGGALRAALSDRDAVAVTRASGPLQRAGWFVPADTDAAVVHAAGLSQPAADAEAMTQVHVDMVRRLADLGWRGRLVLLSSSAVYGQPEALPIAETAHLRPVNGYGRHKLAVERGIGAITSARDIPLTILRLSNVYGTPRDLERRRVIALLLAAALRGQPFTTYGDGSSRRDYLHVDDFCRAVRLALAAPPVVANIGSGTGTALSDLIAAVEDITGRAIDLRPGPVRAEPASSVLDIGLGRRALGWRPEVTLAQGLTVFSETFA